MTKFERLQEVNLDNEDSMEMVEVKMDTILVDTSQVNDELLSSNIDADTSNKNDINKSINNSDNNENNDEIIEWTLKGIFTKSKVSIFLQNHGKRLLGFKHEELYDLETNSKPNICRDSSWTNIYVGISCSFFLFPVYTALIIQAWNIRFCYIYECIFWCIVSLFSFLHDYYYCYVDGKRWVGTVDLWTATLGFVLASIKVFTIHISWFLKIIDVLLLFVAVMLIRQSRLCNEKKTYFMVHFIWHLFGGIMLSWLVIQEWLAWKGIIDQHRFFW
mmetsp:Transcript_40289/g.49701  ORF Transcript_40289/g.49701 Transcript_40289/m.49701 type:complete len:274 (-) Transcript_40289:104-925(-)